MNILVKNMDIAKLVGKENLSKLNSIGNKKVISIVEEFVTLCKPIKVTVITDSKEDINYVRELAIKNGEEQKTVDQ